MRRVAPVLCVGLGAFLFIVALSLKVYDYPKVAVAPVDQGTEANAKPTTLVAHNATIFDTDTLSEIQTDLTTRAKTTGDVVETEKSSTPDGAVVWYTTSTTTSSDGKIRSQETEKAAFDANTGMAVNCCGEYVETEKGVKEAVKHKGLIFKFPFETEKKTYPWWDGDMKTSVPVEYKATEKLDGLEVYRFESIVDKQKVGEREVPVSVLKVDSDEASLTADEMYQNHRTFWVEPHTGVIIKRMEDRRTTYAYEGVDRVTATAAVTQYTDETVQDNIDTYGLEGKLLGLIHGWLPWLIMVLGAALIVVGGVLSRRSAAPVSSAVREPVPAGR